MSEAFENTRMSVRRLRAAWHEADEDSRYRFVFWVSGLVMMTVAIIDQFGWRGLLFCAGFIVWAAGNSDKQGT